MRTLTFAFVAVAFGVACGGDSTGPGTRAASVTGFAGDSQIAPSGAAFDFPVGFVTLGSDGQPLEGVHVAWTVTPAGGATLNPTTSVSNANGQVSTVATAGSIPQVITITGTVPGVSAPVTFSALVLDPCAYVKNIGVGQTINGALTTADCRSSWFYDFYALGLPSGQQSLRITMSAIVPNPDTLDTFVQLYRADGPIAAYDDDVVLTQNTNSQLDVIIPGDIYIIAASSYSPGATGSYSLHVDNRAQAMNGCREVWVVNGVSVDDSITNSDCVDASIMPGHFDIARVWLTDSSTITVSLHSAAVNPNLALYRVTGSSGSNYVRSLVASNDDSISGSSPNAFISYHAAPQSEGPYDLMIGTSTAGETGSYTLGVTKSPAPSRRASLQISRSREWWRSIGASLRPPKH